MDVWTRLCVDVTDTGEVIGASYERHVDGERVAMGMARQGRWFGMHSALEEAKETAERDLGVQLLLWP